MNRAASNMGLLAFILFTSFATSRCMDQSVASKLIDSQIFHFVHLLEQAGLVDELDAQIRQHKAITILPTTDKFIYSKASPVLLSWLKKDYNLPLLRQVLKNHIILGNFQPNKSSTSVTTLSGVPLKVTNNGYVYHVEGVPIRKLNVISSGYIVAHTIDSLILSDDINKHFLTFLGEVSKESNSYFSRHQYSKLESDSQALASLVSSDTSVSLGPAPAHMPVHSIAPSSPASPPSISPSVPIPAPTPALTPAPAPSPSLSGKAAWNAAINALEDAGNYKKFIALLKASANETLIQSALDGSATILAPGDYAFGVADESVLEYLNNTGSIDEVILYHVLLDYATYSDFLTGAGSIESGTSKLSVSSYSYETLYKGTTLGVKVVDSTIYFGDNNSTISQKDILAGQGVSISGLSQILIPSELLPSSPPPPPANSAGFVINLDAVLSFGFAILTALFML